VTGANLNGVGLTGATLPGTNLDGATLDATNLDGADLTGANLTAANLTTANLGDVTNLIQTQLDPACGTDAKLPLGLTLNKPCPSPVK
jgi:uncharacterized protein YjbI with pentapeptide repeats